MFLLLFIFTLALLMVVRTFKKSKDLLSPHKKVVLMTGCDSGIGLYSAIHLHNLGFHVFAGFHNVESEGAVMIKKINSERLIVDQMDITKQSEIDAVVTSVAEYCKKNDCQFWSLVNNAGICIAGKLDWQTWSQCENQVNVNLLGPMRTIRAFLPMLKESKGRIVNVGSISVRWPYPKFGPYVGSKCGLEGMSRVLRVDMAPYGIKVIIVAPGNHCRITKLFQHQMKYAQEQWDSMTPEHQKELGDKFWNLQNNVINLSKIQCPDTFEDSEIIRDMESAVIAADPKHYYLSSTLGLKLGCYIYELLPVQIQDYLMLLFAEGIK